MARRATLRASDADREQVAERLRHAAGEGRILSEELEERLEAVFSARTYGELDAVVADLPGTTPSAGASARARLALPHPALIVAIVFLLPVIVSMLIAAVVVITTLFTAWAARARARLVGVRPQPHPLTAARCRRSLHRTVAGPRGVPAARGRAAALGLSPGARSVPGSGRRPRRLRRAASLGLPAAGPAPPSRPQRRLGRGGAPVRGDPGRLRRDREPPAEGAAHHPGDVARQRRSGGRGPARRPRAGHPPDGDRGPRAGPARGPRRGREGDGKAKRPSDEELGYIHTDDTIGKILADAREEFSRRLGDVQEEPVTHRAADLLDDLASWLKRDPGSSDDTKDQARKRP